ncbi:hypothetical protein F5146DRAFT_383171 [Armillaria mellea]|nr:hypothetical protein F5146DRAFT_383171 [Armillaria mellea]
MLNVQVLGHVETELVLSQLHVIAHHKFLVIIFSLCLVLWTYKASPVESGSPTIDTSGNTTPSAEDDGTVVQSPGDSESPTEMQSPGGSGSTTEVDTDNEFSPTNQASQYEYIGPLFVRLKVTMVLQACRPGNGCHDADTNKGSVGVQKA